MVWRCVAAAGRRRRPCGPTDSAAIPGHRSNHAGTYDSSRCKKVTHIPATKAGLLDRVHEIDACCACSQRRRLPRHVRSYGAPPLLHTSYHAASVCRRGFWLVILVARASFPCSSPQNERNDRPLVARARGVGARQPAPSYLQYIWHVLTRGASTSCCTGRGAAVAAERGHRPPQLPPAA